MFVTSQAKMLHKFEKSKIYLIKNAFLKLYIRALYQK